MNDDARPKSQVERMNEYRDLVDAARTIRQNALAADDMVDGLQWIAAGGRGPANLTELKELAEAMEKNAETMQELIEEATDPREVRRDD